MSPFAHCMSVIGHSWLAIERLQDSHLISEQPLHVWVLQPLQTGSTAFHSEICIWHEINIAGEVSLRGRACVSRPEVVKWYCIQIPRRGPAYPGEGPFRAFV